ncbi:membrane hypothetical protein [Candidatus Roizmanbacteria bacterium]|mgnify:FL=1|nr:membrane hypothetical protein [Candidatus Roizmanbacteria bacterium]
MLPSSLLNLGGKGVELSQGVDGRISLPGIALAAAALMYLGKKTGDFLKQKIGETKTVGLTIFGLLAGISTGAIAALYQSPEGVLAAGAISIFSAGMTMSTDSNRKIKK